MMINEQQKNNQMDKREDILKYSAYVLRIHFAFTFSLLVQTLAALSEGNKFLSDVMCKML